MSPLQLESAVGTRARYTLLMQRATHTYWGGPTMLRSVDLLAVPVGVEPTTYGLEGIRLSQLSQLAPVAQGKT
eukprot:scaffold180064_cov30-Prasinocladus_malaysianus.AAC.1